MSSVFFWVSAGMSGLTFCIHTFVGGPRVAVPLLADSHLPRASKWLNDYCWHVITLFTFTMGFGYAYAAGHPDRLELAVFLSPLTAALSILSAAVAFKGKIHPFRFPSTSLFALVSLSGVLGLMFR
ncbi:MAG: hypothetical protein HY014_17485 [Acidobacteria bacterium]|nr:hypothetical protein [Acidobacteriota bacterium]MBI3489928.1 hypothetical protein [Acidobacteriota bacterium]